MIEVRKRKDIAYWNIPVPKPLNKAVDDAVAAGMYATKADFIRDAARDKLKEVKA